MRIQARWWVIVLLLGLAAVLPGVAEEKMDPAAMEKMMAAISPGPHHDHLKAAVGAWKAEGKMWEKPGAGPTPFHGEATFKLVLGGRYLEGVFHSEFNGMPFEGHSIDGFDNASGKHFSIWIDNMGTGYMVSEGECSNDHKTVTTVGEGFDPMKGKKLRMKSVVTTIDKDHMLFVMYLLEGGQETKIMELQYTRK